MAKTKGLYKWVALVIVSFSSFFWGRFTNAAPPEGFDFTVPADAPYEPGELLVRFASKPDGKQRNIIEKNQILNSLGGGTIKRNFKIVPGLTLVELPAGLTVKDALKTFNRADGILHAQPNYILKALSTFPNDPNFAQLWGMHNTGQTGGSFDADIDAPQAWDIATDSDIIVAVIDSGVDYTHPDLVANMWINPGEIPSNGIDDDGNGYVDDTYGYDFCRRDDGQTDSDPCDDNCHGTHCAGTIGAIGNNGVGVTGVCWNVKIMALKFLDYTGTGDTADAIDCIEYAIEMGAKVLSNSWGGGPYDQDLESAIENSGDVGVLFVAAAGNDRYPAPDFPALFECENIISVLATDHDDEKWFDSNYGVTSVDLGAPGVDILSTFPTYETDTMAYYGFSTDYEMLSGTSMATPHVAGACALVWSMNRTLNHLEVRDIILNTVDRLVVLDGLCVTGGRLNLYNAIVNTPTLTLDKVDNVNDGDSVLPDDEITYTIYYCNPVNDPCDPNYIGDVNDVVITDYLPYEVDFILASGPNMTHNMSTNTVTWNIGHLGAGEPNDSVTLTVKVNEEAEPLGVITNRCGIRSDVAYNIVTEQTDVNSWNPGVIYVDVNATGSNTGMSWMHAYKDLQDALAQARTGCGSEIWVAKGTYYTHTDLDPAYWDVSFELVDGVGLYGGFAGYETSRNQRNWIINETIFDGDIGGSYESNTDYLVTAKNLIYQTIIDGFTIRAGAKAGIKIDGCSLVIRNSKIVESQYFTDAGYQKGYGIECINSSSPNITNCNIQDNATCGIYCNGGSYGIANCSISGNGKVHTINGGGINGNNCSSMTIEHCTLNDNKGTWGGGIYNYESSPTIENCIFNANTTTILSGGGMCNTDSSNPNLTNCIFIGNTAKYYGGGIYNRVNSSPTIANCIFYGNQTTNHEGGGGGIGNSNSSPKLINCALSENSALNGGPGGGMYNYQSSPTVTNCIFWGNTASNSKEIYNAGSNPTVSYCDIEQGNPVYPGEENIKVDPCFVNDDANNYHLAQGSPCIDRCNPNFNPNPGETDIDGEPRKVDGDGNGSFIVDIGADEYYWSPADFDRNEIVNFVDYSMFANVWKSNSSEFSLDDDDYVGYDDLKLFCDDWLWTPAWDQPMDSMMMGEGMGGGMSQSISQSVSLTEFGKQLVPELTAEGLIQSEGVYQSEPVEEKQPEPITQQEIEDTLKWLDEVRLNPEVREAIDKDDWLEFVELVKSSLQ